MPITVSTSDVAPAARGRFWHSQVNELYFPVDMPPGRQPGGRREHHAYLRRVAFGSFTVDQVRGGPGRLVRSSRLTRDHPGEHVFLSVLCRGRCTVAQAGRTAVLSAPGDFYFFDTAYPYAEEFAPQTEKVILQVPRELLLARAPDLLRMVAVTVSAGQGLAAAAAALVLALPLQEQDRPCDPLADSAGTTAVDLAVGALHEQAGRPRADEDSPQAALLARAQRYMLDYQHAGALSAASVAQAVSVSERYLYILFEQAGSSPAAWLRTARLERARRMLADPRHSHQAIGEIAALAGFANSAHFSRAFRRQYDMTPRAWRSTHP
jgi:AraC-like DNA-binding protein